MSTQQKITGTVRRGIIMEIQQLQYYLELCKEKNFTEAGFNCSISQSALSKQIRKLEKELNVTLIRRNTRKFELTPEGLLVQEYAEKALRLHMEMLENIHAGTELKIGSMAVLAPYHIAAMLASFSHKYPGIDLSLEENSAEHILANMAEFDFAILRDVLLDKPDKYKILPLYDDFLCVIVYGDHPLAGRKSIRLKELKDETFVFPQKGTGGYEAFYESCQKAGFEPDIRYEFPQANTIMSFVKEKMGITINFSKVYSDAAVEGLKMIPLEDDFHYPISLVYQKTRTLSEAQKAFIRFVKKWSV